MYHRAYIFSSENIFAGQALPGMPVGQAT